MKQAVSLLILVFAISMQVQAKDDISLSAQNKNLFEINSRLGASKDVCYRFSKNKIQLGLNFTKEIKARGKNVSILKKPSKRSANISYTVRQNNLKGEDSVDQYSLVHDSEIEFVKGRVAKFNIASSMTGDASNFNTKSSVLILGKNNQIAAKSICTNTFSKHSCATVSRPMCQYFNKNKSRAEVMKACGTKCTKSLSQLLPGTPAKVAEIHDNLLEKVRYHHMENYISREGQIPESERSKSQIDISSGVHTKLNNIINQSNILKGPAQFPEWDAAQIIELCDSLAYHKEAKKVAHERSLEKKISAPQSRIREKQATNCVFVPFRAKGDKQLKNESTKSGFQKRPAVGITE